MDNKDREIERLRGWLFGIYAIGLGRNNETTASGLGRLVDELSKMAGDALAGKAGPDGRESDIVQEKKFRIGIDIDGTISYAPEFFAGLTHCFSSCAEIHIITARCDPCDSVYEEMHSETVAELKAYGIYYDAIALTCDKASYISEKNINIFFENTDEEFIGLPEEVICFKIREDYNFDWDKKLWVYGSKTGRSL